MTIQQFATLPLATLSLFALACQPPREHGPPHADEASTATELPTPIRPEPPAIAADQATVIRQIEIGLPQTWRFEPGGRRVAARVGDACGVWQLDGIHLGIAEAEAEPCRTWAPLEPLAWTEDENFTLVHPDGKRRLTVGGDRFELAGSELRGRARGGRRYLAAAFGPDGARLALLAGRRDGPLEIEIWSLDHPRVERSLAFDRSIGESFDASEWETGRAWIEWTERSLAAAVEVCVRGECDATRIALVRVWPALDQPALVRRFPLEDDEFGTSVTQIHLDPEHRSLFATIEGIIPDDGRTGWVFEGIDLEEAGEVALQPGLWVDEADERAIPPTQTEWRDDVGSSRWRIAEQDCCYEDEIGWAWSVLSLTALPDRSIELAETDGFVPREHESDVAPSVGKVGRGRLVPGDAPAGCSVIDAAWRFDRLLLACDDRWLLSNMPEPGRPLALAGAHELARGTGEPRQVIWGPRGLAIWTFVEGLRLFDGERLVAIHADVAELHRAVLDEELDLALIRDHEGLRAVDLERSELGPTLAWTGPVELAAFAPERGRVAIAGGGELAVFAIAEPSAIHRWSTGALAGIAFRQDGAVLWVGRDRPLPELALDPMTGEQVVAAQLDRVAFDRIAAAALDPSWRWAIEPDGTLLRTIDGQALIMSDEANALAESGWFVGEVRPDLHRLRVGPEPFGAVIDPGTLAGQLVRPDLVAEFLSGRPLPPPRLTPP